MKKDELRKLSRAEFESELLALLRERFSLRMQHATHQLTQTHHLKNVRKKIARLLTIMHEETGRLS